MDDDDFLCPNSCGCSWHDSCECQCHEIESLLEASALLGDVLQFPGKLNREALNHIRTARSIIDNASRVHLASLKSNTIQPG